MSGMEGILALASLALFVLPIIAIAMIAGLRTKVDDLEGSLKEMRKILLRLGGSADPGAPAVNEAPVAVPAAMPVSEVHEPEPESLEAPEPPLQPLPPPLPPQLETPLVTAAPEKPRKPVPYIPPEPSWVEIQAKRLFSWLFAEGNVWVTVGVMLFIAGFGLLFSYIERRGLIPFEVRLIAASIVGICMSLFGWRMREARRTYALILQGGGIGVLYIVLLAGVKIGSAIPPQASVIGMLLLSGFTVILALLQDFELLALFALLGGYSAPVIVSTGSANFIALFSIHSLMNFEILLLSSRADWRKTRWAGLVASVGVGVVWGVLRWRDEYFASVEPFLILLFVNYTAVTLLPMLRGKFKKFVKSDGGVDLPMIITLPFVFLFLQMAAASHTKYGVALSCLGLGAWYLSFGKIVMGRGRSEGYPQGLLLAYCVIFSNLAIPFIFRQAVSSAIWAVEGSFLIAFAATGGFENGGGERDDRGRVPAAFACGMLLHIGAFVLYNFSPWLHLPSHISEISLAGSGLLDWRSESSPFLLTGFLFAVSAFVGSYFSTRLNFGAEPLRPAKLLGFEVKLPSAGTLVWGFAAYGALWWTLAALNAAFVSLRHTGVTAFSVLCASAAVGYILSVRLRWGAIRLLAAAPVLVVTAHVALILTLGFPTGLRGIPGWLPFAVDLTSNVLTNWLGMAALFASAAYAYRNELPSKRSICAWGGVLFAALAYTSYHVLGEAALVPSVAERFVNISFLARFLPTALAVILLTVSRFEERTGLARYMSGSLAVLVLLMVLNLPSLLFSFGEISSIGGVYVPLFNPVELFQALFFASMILLLRRLPAGAARRASLYRVVPLVAFLLLNGVAARAARQYYGEKVWYDFFGGSPYFQGFLAILWGLAALGLISFGKKYTDRSLWAIGAGLLALDIVKLLLIDLKNSATVIRIFAFLLLGALFLLIGWIAPLPPKLAGPQPMPPDGEDEPR
ncbi:MAG: DUF2339 domain-containing protein [Synergistaceae bacterium]|jgi:uncharacterized membrane protein|nr:DUF2339 domain-containing protein [Synergistaceae bacterium]